MDISEVSVSAETTVARLVDVVKTLRDVKARMGENPEKRGLFKMDYWVDYRIDRSILRDDGMVKEPVECGFAGCAIGWYIQAGKPEFFSPFTPYNRDPVVAGVTKEGEEISGYDAIEVVFGLNPGQSRWLFSPTNYCDAMFAVTGKAHTDAVIPIEFVIDRLELAIGRIVSSGCAYVEGLKADFRSKEWQPGVMEWKEFSEETEQYVTKRIKVGYREQ